MAHKILIAGVGRSGTSFLFQEMATALRAQGTAHFFYEPYLWAPRKVNETGQIRTEPFDTRNLSPFGIYVHCESPLFLDGSHPVHDLMLDRILKTDAHVMAKVIRGNGRLRAYLQADPELRIVGMLRDVFGTVNSVSNHFSFFGSEFHPSDRPRFVAEIRARYGETLDIPPGDEADVQAVWSAYWWKYHSRALFEAKAAYPDRVCLIDYDSLLAEPDRAYQAMEALTDLPLRQYRLKSSVGIVSGANYLETVPLDRFAPFQTWFQEQLTAAGTEVVLSENSVSVADLRKVVARFQRSRPAVVPRYPEHRTGVGWRYACQALEQRAERLESLHDKALRQYRAAASGMKGPLATPGIVAEGAVTPPGISVIVPVWNAEAALEETVASIWAQNGVHAEVILVDDASTDGSAALAESLLAKGPGQLVRNRRNLGPALSRHKGILQAKNPVVSTLDADDHIYPFKLQREIEALGDDPGAVAYSQVEYCRFGQSRLWDYAALNGLDKTDFLESIAGRRSPLPRDMTFRKTLYDRTRGFDGTLRMYEDFAWKIELADTASRWINTNELGMRYVHSATGASAAGPGKHIFFLHAAILRNADMLALRLEMEVLTSLKGAVSAFDVPADVSAGLARLEETMRFVGNILGALQAMRLETWRLIFREDLSYNERLKRIYACLDRPGGY